MVSEKDAKFLAAEYQSLWREFGLDDTERWLKPLESWVRAVRRPKPSAAGTLPGLEAELVDLGLKLYGEGKPGASIMFIGEAPGEEEAAAGRPFLGKAGDLLNRIIEAMGKSRNDVYLTYLCKSRVDSERLLSPTEISEALPTLAREIALIHPRLIVALGLTAGAAITGKSQGMAMLRGKFAPAFCDPSIEVMPTYHPAYLLRNPAAKKDTWEDMKMVMARLEARA